MDVDELRSAKSGEMEPRPREEQVGATIWSERRRGIGIAGSTCRVRCAALNAES